MISLELAKELKEAGLTFEQQSQTVFFGNSHWFFAPTLSQLLGEIEARGWSYYLTRDIFGEPTCAIWLSSKPTLTDAYVAKGEIEPEAAVAQALIWILREGKE